MKKFRIWDLVLIVGILAVAGVLFLALQVGKPAGAGVIVRVDGREVARYTMTQEGTYSLNGGTNILQIADGAAWLTHADCPDELCVRQGKVRKTGQVITCLPNKLTVTVFGADSEVELIS